MGSDLEGTGEPWSTLYRRLPSSLPAHLLSPDSPIHHLLSQDSLASLILPALGASSCPTTFHTSYSPPAATLLRPRPASLPGFTLSDLCLLQPHMGCSSRCLRVKQGTCLCPHTAEGSLPSLQCLVLPGTGALVQVLTNATPTRVNWAAVEAGCAGDSDPENQACS